MNNGYRQIGDFIIRPAKYSDFFLLGSKLIQPYVGDISKYADSPVALMSSFAFLADRKVMGIGGYVKFWPGVAEAWSVWLIEAGEKHVKSMIQSARTLNDEYISEHKIWRLQATRPAGIPDTWFKHMGFTKECTHEYYGMNGEHTDMYCRIIESHLPDRN